MNALSRLWAAAGLGVRRPLLRRRLGRTVIEEVAGVPLVVLPGVFNPKVFRTGEVLARAVAAGPPPAARPGGEPPLALDLGTGSGVGAIFAARLGYRVIAVDLNPQAVRCVRANAVLHGLEERIEARQGDLFAPVAGERFDLVLWNPPYFRGAPRNPLDAAWRSVDALERFAAGLPAALAPGGRALVVLSTDGDCSALLATHREGGMEVGVAARRDFGNEVVTVHSVAAPRPAAAAAREEARSEPGRLHAQGAGA